MEVFSWLAGISQKKAQWKCAMTACGGQCATHFGMQAMPGSCATSWVTPLVSITLADHEYALNHLMLTQLTSPSTIPSLDLGWLQLHGAMLVAVEAVKGHYLSAASLLQ